MGVGEGGDVGADADVDVDGGVVGADGGEGALVGGRWTGRSPGDDGSVLLQRSRQWSLLRT